MIILTGKERKKNMEHKKYFTDPVCEILRFSVEDIITTSDGGDIPDVTDDRWLTDEF